MTRPWKKRAAAAAAAIAAAVAAAWFAAPWLVDDPMPEVLARTPVRTWTDRNGAPLYYERTWNYEWRFNVALSNIAPEAVAVMIETEDARFFRHHGVDYQAVLRALFQDIFSLRVVSGASTISMQLAAMDYRTGRRTFAKKLVQAAKARKLERLHTKEEILEAYFNNIPYGGSIFGIEAASRYYFGMHASEISLAEASVLCGLPQRPNRYRPDRHPEAARTRQRRVLDRLVRTGRLTQEESDRIFRDVRLRYRDFSLPAAFETRGQARELFFLIGRTPKMRPGDPDTRRLEIDARLTKRIRDALARRVDALDDVHDAAAVVLDAKTGETLAYVGTLDFDSPLGGQVDAARAIRSAGSALKPFIYFEALKGGYLVAESVVVDAPVRYADYRPENYDRSFSGRVSVTQALSQSLNTPAVRVLAELGEGRIAASFRGLGLAAPGQVVTNGLSLALGTAGYRLVDIAQAYRALVPERAEDAAEGAREMIAEILRELPLNGTHHPVAWKTGTSNNNCDAWCFAYTTDYVAGVWFGNKDGSRAKSLVGAEVAAPAAGEIFEILYEKRPPPFWPDISKRLAAATLCAATGHTASSSCAETFTGRALRDIPLRVCPLCALAAKSTAILSPAPKTYLLPDGQDSVSLSLKANADDAAWFVDGSLLEPGATQHDFGAGEHTVTAVPLDPDRGSAQVTVTVRRRQ